MEHRTTIIESGAGTIEATCLGGWRSERYDTNPDTTGAGQQAKTAADLHEWDAAMS